MNPTLSDLTVGVPPGLIRSNSRITEVSGGEDVFTDPDIEVEDSKWCEGSAGSANRSIVYVQRNTVTIEADFVDYLKDFVIQAGLVDESVAPKYYENLFNSPISNDHSVPILTQG